MSWIQTRRRAQEAPAGRPMEDTLRRQMAWAAGTEQFQHRDPLYHVTESFQQTFDAIGRRHARQLAGGRTEEGAEERADQTSGENQMPEVYGLLPPICEQLGIDTPELYYVRDKRANAATFGSVHPCIYVTSGLVNKLPLNLLPSVLAHECGHIACKHSLYHSIAAQLAGGIDRSPLVRIPAIGKYLTPTLVKALLFWDRCSELSADRAAALCDGTADKTIDVLLRLNGYGKNVDRKEFLNQALDLKSFVNDSRSNKLLELMLVQDETHPRLATRAYECYEWSQSAQYAGIIDGTFTLRDKEKETAQESAEEVVSADANVEAPSIDCLNTELARVNQELERYTNHADKTDYALSVAGGQVPVAPQPHGVGEAGLADPAVPQALVGDGVQPVRRQRQMLSPHQIGEALGKVEIVHALVAHGQIPHGIKGNWLDHPGGDIQNQKLDLQLVMDKAGHPRHLLGMGLDTIVLYRRTAGFV